ncbi:MAG: HAMP domain-containing protein, partial [Chloroflexi bacterium]|nr:HAMP domain-containing protein [Chloroflexota bacterium]
MTVPKLFIRWVARLNLWSRLVLVLTAGFAMLFGVFSAVSLRVLDDSTQRILTERVVIAQFAARRYDELLTQAYYELDKATTFAAFDPAAPDLTNEKHMLAHAYGRLGSFSLGVVFLDARGRVVLAQPDAAQIIGADYSAFPFISQTMQTRERNISRPFLDSNSGKFAIAVTIPLFDRDGRLMAILSGWADLSSPLMMTAVEQARNLGETGHAELVDNQGMVIATTESDSQPLAPGEHLHFYLQMLNANREGVQDVPDEMSHHASEMHVMAFAPLTVTHWGVAVGGSESETFAPVRQLENSIFILGTISFAIIFLATLLGARLLVRPVKVLTRAAKQIATGDLQTPIQVVEGGEIGALAEAFEAMRVRLQKSLTEITAWSNELEMRVRERTQELETVNVELQREESERRRLLERVINVQEEERKRVARELHDETGQALTAVLMSLEEIETRLPATSHEQQNLARAQRLAENALSDLRVIIHGLRPTVLDDLGLVPAIRAFAEQHLAAHHVQVSVETQDWEARLPAPIETVLFRILQEAVNNIAR